MSLHQPTDIVFILSTCESIAQAESLARKILESKLAACVTTIPGAISSYWWQGKIEKSQEVLLQIKTVSENISKIKLLFDSYHPYEVPELVVIPISEGSTQYLDWIRESVEL